MKTRTCLFVLVTAAILPWVLLAPSAPHYYAAAQVVPGQGVILRDEGTSLGKAGTLDCVGGGITCTLSGGVGTVTVSGGGGGASMAIGATIGGGTPHSVLFIDGSGNLAQDVNLYYDPTDPTGSAYFQSPSGAATDYGASYLSNVAAGTIFYNAGLSAEMKNTTVTGGVESFSKIDAGAAGSASLRARTYNIGGGDPANDIPHVLLDATSSLGVGQLYLWAPLGGEQATLDLMATTGTNAGPSRMEFFATNNFNNVSIASPSTVTGRSGGQSLLLRWPDSPPAASGYALIGNLDGDGAHVNFAFEQITVATVNGVAYPASPSTNTVPVVTGTNTITYEAVPNAALANSSTTVNGTSCTLGSTCTVATYNTGTAYALVPPLYSGVTNNIAVGTTGTFVLRFILNYPIAPTKMAFYSSSTNTAIMGMAIYNDGDAGTRLYTNSGKVHSTVGPQTTTGLSATTLQPGTPYRFLYCSTSSATSTYLGVLTNSLYSPASGTALVNAFVTSFGSAGNTCTSGVPPATTGTITNVTTQPLLPLLLLSTE